MADSTLTMDRLTPLKGANGDDQYLAVVQHLGVADGEQRTSGDTTDANAQLRALAHFGVSARLVQNVDFQLIEQQINRGIPIPCGYLHRGPAATASAGWWNRSAAVPIAVPQAGGGQWWWTASGEAIGCVVR